MSGLIPAMPPVRLLKPTNGVASQVRQHVTMQQRFNQVARTPSFFVPLLVLLLVGAVLTGMSHWALRTIITYWIGLPAAVAFGIIWVGSSLLLIIDLYREPSWRTLLKVRWTYVTNALLIGFFAGLWLMRLSLTIPR